jgi:hypothetical protein
MFTPVFKDTNPVIEFLGVNESLLTIIIGLSSMYRVKIALATLSLSVMDSTTGPLRRPVEKLGPTKIQLKPL